MSIGSLWARRAWEQRNFRSVGALRAQKSQTHVLKEVV